MNPFGRRFTISAERGRLKLVPTGHGAAEPVSLAGRAVAGPADLLNEDVISTGDRRYRFKRIPE